MSLSNWTLGQIWIEDSRPEDVAEPWMTICAGVFMMVVSSLVRMISVSLMGRNGREKVKK